MDRTWILGMGSLVVLLAACFNPDEPDTYYCNAAAGKTWCPADQVCRGTVCMARGTKPDGGRDLRVDARDMAVERKPDSKPDLLPDLKHDLLPDLQPDSKPDSKPDLLPDQKHDLLPDLQPDVLPDQMPSKEAGADLPVLVDLKPDQQLSPCTPYQQAFSMPPLPANWKVGFGTWSVTAGYLLQGASSNPSLVAPYYILYTGAVYGDFTVEVEATKHGSLSTKDLALGIIYRVQDHQNFYFALFKPNDNKVALYRVQAGIEKELKANTLTVSTSHTLRVQVKGASHVIYFDNKQVIGATDSTFTQGQVGLATHKTAGRFDDFTITCP